jgi:glyoxylase-like metal-dependent hydrolase (beta-lactamase superfamily II)
VGWRRAAIVDPGPRLEPHVAALAEAVADADSVTILLTHGHSDHSGAAADLAERLNAPIRGAWASGSGEAEVGVSAPPPGTPFQPMRDGDAVATDAGELVAVHTPGHAHDHVAFSWPAESAVFVGDLMLGAGETTWVGAYPGCVADYLASLDRIQALDAGVLLPTHGPPITDPAERIERYRAHRRARIAQVARALAASPAATLDELLRTIYGDAGADVQPAARASLEALIEHVRSGRG